LFDQPWIILGLLGILISVKFVVLYVLSRFFGLRAGENMLFSFALAQGGEFAFVLISFATQNRIFTDELSGILLIVVALSMALSPILLIINEKVVQPLMYRSDNASEQDEIEGEESPVIIAGFGRFGVVVGRLLMANGFKATVLDNNPEHVEVLRKFGFKVYYGDASRPDLLKAAGAEQAKILIIAIDNKEQALELLAHAKREYPHLKILGRAIDMRHVYE
jgi:hypothetical protein